MKKIFLLISALAIFNVSATIAQTSISGGTVSGTWTTGGSPYNITGSIQIPSDSTLIIQPGVIVNFQGTYKLNVQGRLLAIGTIADSITFTAANTTSGWRGIRFNNTPVTNDTSKIIFCKLQYGKATGSSPDDCGGALYFNNVSKTIISHSIITNCMANSFGGGIYCKGSILSTTCCPTISYNTISNNTASSGGGIACDLYSNPTIFNNTISNNTASSTGGGIYCTSCNSIISYNTISNNTASGTMGVGGIYCENGNPIIKNNSIVNNTSTYYGGGIYCTNSNLSILNNIISNNNANSSGSYGGGICCNMSSPAISNNIISNNTASVGGGIYCQSNSDPVISNNTISNNLAILNGGGIDCESSSSPSISNNIISNNTSNSNGGGIYCNGTSLPNIINSTITNNSAVNGGGLFCNTSNPSFRNCILYGNTASTDGSQVFLFDDSSDPNFYYCNVQGSSAAFGLNGNFYSGTYTNNINADPKFVSPSGGSGTGFNGTSADWSLQNTSPCIDKGDPTYSPYPSTDMAGNPRINVCRIDIGAYEYQVGIPFTASLNITQPILCNGSATGEVTAIASGGTSPYTYLWSNGKTTANITGLVAGNYSVTVSTASYGCALTKSIILTQPPVASIEAGADSTIMCGNSVHLRAQPKWITLTSGTTSQLNSVYFPNKDTGYVVGNSGTILKTTNGGTSWTILTSGTNNPLYSVYFIQADTGYVVGIGSEGTILKTTNGGASWVAQTTGISNVLVLSSVYFTTANIGYIVGVEHTGNGSLAIILKTTNGGTNWTAQIRGAADQLNSVYFTNKNNGCAVGIIDTVLTTTDGGINWTAQTSGTISIAPLYSVYFTDINNGYAVGDGIFKTSNAGSLWTIQTSGIYSSLYSVYFSDVNTGYVVGNMGTILKTTNSGTNWIQQTSGTTVTLRSVYFPDVNTGYAIGNNGTILKSPTPPDSYSWSPANGLSASNIANPVASPNVTTTYIVTAKTNGCAVIDSVTIHVNSLTANAGVDKSIICGNTAQLDSVTINYTGSGILKYHWSPSTGLSNDTIANPKVTAAADTKYFVTVTTPAGCTAIDSIVVHVNPLVADAGLDNSLICGGAAQLNATANYTGTGKLTYNWSPIAALNYDTIQDPKATVTSNTKIFVTITTPNGCTAIDSVVVHVNPLIADAGLDNSLICGGAAQLNATANYTGTGKLTYNWTPIAGLNYDTIQNPKATVTTDTKYFVTITTPNGCTSVDSVNVFVNPFIADAGLDKQIICGGTAQLDNVNSNYTGTGKLTYNWSPIAGLNYDTIQDPKVTVTSNTKFFVTVTTPNGCSAVDSVHVLINPLTANAGSDKTLICGSTVQLDNVTSNYTGTGALTYKWTPTTGMNYDTIPNPDVTIFSNNTYTVTVTTPNGCSAKDSVHVSLIPMNAPEICVVGVDSLNKNRIIWNKAVSSAIDSFYVYKETGTTNVYAKIGAVPYNNLSVFVDNSSYPNVQSNKYKISIFDDCGLESAQSDYHKTMHLTINQGTASNIWNLIWEEYAGFTVSSYRIYRGTSPDTLQQIGTVLGGNTTYTDVAPTGYIYYQIEVVSPNNCNPTRSYNSSRSNIASNNGSGINENNNASDLVSIYPDPAKESITIDFAEYSNDHSFAEIFNVDGKLLQHISITQKKTDVDISRLPSGIYIIKVTGNNDVAIKKLVKE